MKNTRRTIIESPVGQRNQEPRIGPECANMASVVGSGGENHHTAQLLHLQRELLEPYVSRKFGRHTMSNLSEPPARKDEMYCMGGRQDRGRHP